MLSTNTILSLDQGKLFAKPKSEDEYYGRYLKEAQKPNVEQRHAWHFLGWEWGGYPTASLK